MPYNNPKKITPKFPTFYKAYGKGSISPETGEILVSSCILPGLMPTIKKALNNTQLNLGEIYIVCPQYFDKKTGELADLQLTITGTPLIGENVNATALREIQEETGFAPTRCMKSVQRLDGYKRPVENYWCEINTSTPFLSHVASASDIQAVKQQQDDRSRKIQILAFGKLSDLEHLLQNDLQPLPASDNIPALNQGTYLSGIRLVSILDMIDILGFDLDK